MLPEVAERYIKEFWIDAKGLNVREATTHPKATENIDAIIEIISTLVEKGYAYLAEGDVYFRTAREGHNLDRCRCQFALVADMERKEAEMKVI